MIGSAQHESPKQLTDILKPVVEKFSSFVVKDSFSFSESMHLFRDPLCETFMCSFDVRSLFTNVPLDETINICMNTLYRSEQSAPTIEESILKKLLAKATKEVEFSFSDIMCKHWTDKRNCDGLSSWSYISKYFCWVPWITSSKWFTCD